MRALVTGASGFAGTYLCAALADAGDEVVRLSRSNGQDAMDPEQVLAAVAEAQPDAVFHLAAQAHVGRSWEDPGGTLNTNTTLTVNILEAVRAEAPEAAIVVASSGELYGAPEYLPVDESHPVRPQNPYAVSKATTDLLARFYFDAHGLRTVRARAFNHAGPGQDAAYAIASFTRQLAAGLAAGSDRVRIVTGNSDTRRDYTDVRDVVRAYRALALAGEPGEAYNVCSDQTASARELVAVLGEAAGIEIDHFVDPELVRAHEVMEIRGSFDKLRAATGWRPQIPLERTLADTVAWWRAQFTRPRQGA